MLVRHVLSLFLACTVVLMAASSAHAHLMNTGFGPFYDGLAHPFLTPEELLPVIALTLLAGLRGPRFGRTLLFVLPAAWFVGSIAGRLLALPAPPSLVTATLMLTLGAMVATDRPWSLMLITVLAILFGLFDGSIVGGELAKAHASNLVAVGITAALSVVVSLFAGQVATVRAFAARVALRAAGSWIAAIGLFMVGWAMRGG